MQDSSHTVIALKKTIAQNVIKFHKNVPQWSSSGETPGVDINDIFVDKLNLQGNEEIRHYTDIAARFKHTSGNGRRIVLVGDAGAGKETLARRLLVDWSQRVLRPFDNEHFSWLDQYCFVVPIFCSDIITSEDKKGDLTLADIIGTQLELQPEYASFLMDHIRKDPISALFVIIGYGTRVAGKSGELRALVNGVSLSKVNGLITCRTYILSELPGIQRDEDIELHGFAPFGPEDYVDNFWSIKSTGKDTKTEKESKKNFLKNIESQYDLRACSKIPSLLLLMCILWNDGGKLADTMTGLYMAFLKYMCSRYERKYVYRNKRTLVEDLLNKYIDPILEISALAKKGLLLNGLETSFYYELAKQNLSPLSWRLGFLTYGKTKYLSNIVQFHHRTMQEFFIAIGTVYGNKGDEMQTLMNMCSSAQRLGNSKIILAFVCGLSKALSLRIKALIEQEIDHWDEMDKVNSHMYRADFLLRLSQETSYSFNLPSTIHLDPKLYETKALEKFFSMNGENVKEIILTNILKVNEISFLSRLDHATLDSLEIHGALKPIYLLEQDEQFSDADVIHPGVIIKSLRPKLIKFKGISDNTGLVTTVAVLQHMRELASIWFVDCALESNGIIALSRILKRNQTTAQAISPSVPELSDLYLHYCECYKDGVMDTLIQTLRHQSSLRVLSSIGNTFCSSGLKVLADVMPCFPRLRVLRLVSTRCLEKHVWVDIVGSLANVPDLEELDLSSNHIGADGVQALVVVLQKGVFSSLRKIALNFCNIKESRVVLSLLQNVQHTPLLQELGVSANSLGDALKDITVIDFPSNLSTLNIGNNKLSKTVVDHLLYFFNKRYPNTKVIVDQLSYTTE